VLKVKVAGAGACPSLADDADAIEKGETFELVLDKTPHPALVNGSKATLSVDGTAETASVVVVDNSLWPKITFAPLADMSLTTVNLRNDEGKLAVAGDLFVLSV
jgi:hypothetical protein